MTHEGAGVSECVWEGYLFSRSCLDEYGVRVSEGERTRVVIEVPGGSGVFRGVARVSQFYSFIGSEGLLGDGYG